MRKNVFIFSALITIVLSYCSNGHQGNNAGSVQLHNGKEPAEIKFRDYEHDFGKVTEGEKISYVFTFDNHGASDLVIYSATTTCGCTVPKYDSKPIAPGRSGTIEVVFDTSGRNGTQTKIITVKSNAATPVVMLKITCDVAIKSDNNN